MSCDLFSSGLLSIRMVAAVFFSQRSNVVFSLLCGFRVYVFNDDQITSKVQAREEIALLIIP
jgi:hypothetical protein